MCIVRRGSKISGEAECLMDISNFTFSESVLYMDVKPDWCGTNKRFDHRCYVYGQPQWSGTQSYNSPSNRSFRGYFNISEEMFRSLFVTMVTIQGKQFSAWCDQHVIVPVWGEEAIHDYKLLESFEVPRIETDQSNWIMSLE